MEQGRYHFIKVEVEGDTTTITFCRPEVRNAFNSKMIKEITSAVAAIDSLFLVFRGAGSVFSAGADIDYMRKIARMGYNENIKDAKLLALLFEEITKSSAITISMVQGAAMGGGNGIIAASDFSIAAENTLFSFSEVKLGLIPATISPYVLSRLGRSKTLELFLSGRQFAAVEAKQIGLITIVAEQESMDVELDRLKQALRLNSPAAMRSVKRLMGYLENNLPDMVDVTSSFIADARSSIDGQEGLAAFLEKRKPSWFNAETNDKGW